MWMVLELGHPVLPDDGDEALIESQTYIGTYHGRGKKNAMLLSIRIQGPQTQNLGRLCEEL